MLANREFDLLRFLMERSGQVIGHDEILTEVWGSADLRSSKTLDMHISWLRRKIGDDRRDRPRHIVTVRGVGFGSTRDRDSPRRTAHPGLNRVV